MALTQPGCRPGRPAEPSVYTVDPRLLARVLLAVVAIAALVGSWLAIQPPDDLTRLPEGPADLRLGPRAAAAAQRCRERLFRERPTLDDNSIVLLGVTPIANDRDAGALRVSGSFRQKDIAGAARSFRFRCTVDSTGLRRLEVSDADD